jgi:ATP-dependent Lhr-like helicase
MKILIEKPVFTAFYGRFHRLREAQEAVIEPLLSGRNVVLTSGTGSGKTEAVMAPLVNKYWRATINQNSLFLLYIAPTKALVNDLEKRLYPPLSYLNLRVGVRHGDRDDLKSGSVPHVLITTPESLDVMLFRNDAALKSISAIVIDEVHLLFNTQRGLQLSILLKRLQKVLPKNFQWAALSATIGDLSGICEFLMGPKAEADLIGFSATREVNAQIRYISSPNQFLEMVQKITDGRPTKLLVFANSRRECEKLSGILQQDKSMQHNVFTHYSSLSSGMRIETERKFSAMQTAICVATSTLELGIDIGDIDAVLLWGVPAGVDSFLQRIGRSNRRSNKTNVICLVPDESESVLMDCLQFAVLINASKKGVLPIREPYELYGAVGQQCLSIIASGGGRYTRIAELYDLVKHLSHLSRDIVEAILAEIASNGFLQKHGYKNQYGADEEIYRLVDMKLIYGNFGIGSQTVEVFHGAKNLGEVPAINLLRIRKSVSVRFAGKKWEIKKVSRDGIHLEPSRNKNDFIDFVYGGSGIRSDPFITDGIWELIHSGSISPDIFNKDLFEKISDFIDKLRFICSKDQIPYLRTPDGIRYYTFAGYIINRAIGLYTKKPDFKADDFSLLVPSMIDWALIPDSPTEYEDFFHMLFEVSAEQSLYQKQLPLDLQEREYLQGWLKDKVIPKILARLSKATAIQNRDSLLL